LAFLLSTPYSCTQKNSAETDLQSNSESEISLPEKSSLKAEGFYFAKRRQNGVAPNDPPVFNRGDMVYLVVQNVGEFKRGKDGLNHVEMHMEIRNQIGAVIINKRNMLKNKGEKDLKNNILKNPYANYKTDLKEQPGTYHFTLTLVDNVTRDSLTTQADYFLE
jgi:hypothetical protein